MCKAICSVETRQREKPTKAQEEEGEDLSATFQRLKHSIPVSRVHVQTSTQLPQEVHTSLFVHTCRSVGQLAASAAGVQHLIFIIVCLGLGN